MGEWDKMDCTILQSVGQNCYVTWVHVQDSASVQCVAPPCRVRYFTERTHMTCIFCCIHLLHSYSDFLHPTGCIAVSLVGYARRLQELDGHSVEAESNFEILRAQRAQVPAWGQVGQRSWWAFSWWEGLRVRLWGPFSWRMVCYSNLWLKGHDLGRWMILEWSPSAMMNGIGGGRDGVWRQGVRSLGKLWQSTGGFCWFNLIQACDIFLFYHLGFV